MLHFSSNKYYGSSYIDNNLLIHRLNKNIFHIERNMKRKRKNVNVTLLDHINESKINKLYKEKFFDPNDYESLGDRKSVV